MKDAIKSILNKLGIPEWIEYREKKKEVLRSINYKDKNIYHNMKGNVLFIHIPKTAGMSFVKSLYNKDSSHHAKAIDFKQVDNSRFEKSFSFVITRNPYTRIYSAYNYLSTGGKETIDRVWRDLYVRKYRNFNDFVLRGLNKAVCANAEHFIPQYKFVTDELDNVICDFIGKFEEMNQVVLQLQKQGIIINLPKLNSSTVKAVNISDIYSPKMLSVVNELYEKDFELFNYLPVKSLNK
jgi:chondroitin 4-sulfotransferase 11